MGERPQAPWHPLPLSELLILVGAIGTVIGLGRLGHGGISHGGPALFAGIAAVLIGTVEVTLREHLSGYRSHTLILTLLPLIVFHSAVILIVASLTTVPKLLNVALLLVDVGVGHDPVQGCCARVTWTRDASARSRAGAERAHVDFAVAPGPARARAEPLA